MKTVETKYTHVEDAMNKECKMREMATVALLKQMQDDKYFPIDGVSIFGDRQNVSIVHGAPIEQMIFALKDIPTHMLFENGLSGISFEVFNVRLNRAARTVK
jgi:hypothetical protein